MNGDIDIALMACRFGHDAAVMFLWGAFGYLAACVPRDLRLKTAAALARAGSVAVAVAVLTVLARLPIETAMIGDGWRDALDGRTVTAVLFGTSVGTSWIVDALGCCLLVGAALLPPGPRPAALAVSAGLASASAVLTGHAMMREGLAGYLQQGNDLVHVLAAGAWFGALVPLFVILRDFGRGDGTWQEVAALRWFTTAGKIAVVLILASGIVNTLLIVGHWPFDWTSPYQAMLTGKILIVLVMIALAARNRYRLVPLLTRDPERILAAIRRATATEAVLGACVIALVAVFGMLDPS